MAFTIPERLASSAGTSGERKVFSALRDQLPEDCIVYYDVPIGGRYPDFVIVGAALGVVVLEVKDWRLGSILHAGPGQVTLRRPDGGEGTEQNPVGQARDYCLLAVDRLKAHASLGDGRRLACGWGFGAVFPRLSVDEIRTPSLFGPSLEDCLGPGQILAADHLEPGALLPALRALVPDWASRRGPLSAEQVDVVRAVLHPEIRVGWGATDTDVLTVMDREQERLARMLGDGHRLLRGVAGSGKTVALMARARLLSAQHPDWRILLVCFNRTLAQALGLALERHAPIEVGTFHAWCRRLLREAGVSVTGSPERGRAEDDYWLVEVPRQLREAFASGRIRNGRYQAILVDEGQDFADDWYRVLLDALDPATNSLFIALDASQNIYRRRVSWRGLGIQAAGRTRVLRLNYRNTDRILATAYRMIEQLDAAMAAEEEAIAPERAMRTGPAPSVERYGSRLESWQGALRWIRRQLASGVTAEEILILGLRREEMMEAAHWLRGQGMAACVLGGDEIGGGVRVSTVHSAKGLDADAVLVLAVHRFQHLDEASARRLLYIAMTRARRELTIHSHAEADIVDVIERAVLPVAPGPSRLAGTG